jgi:hypothetical protein
MKQLKLYMFLLLILIIPISAIVLVFLNDSPPEISSPKYVIGTITSFKQGQKSSGLDAVVTFLINEKEYEHRIKSKANSGNVIGEKFIVVYEEKKPSNNIVLRYSPVFLDSEFNFLKQTKGKITDDIHKFNFSNNQYIPNYGIEFEYIVNGRKFVKSQSLPRDFKQNFPSIEKGMEFEVEYWLENPQRAIIHLDKPIE